MLSSVMSSVGCGLAVSSVVRLLRHLHHGCDEVLGRLASRRCPVLSVVLVVSLCCFGGVFVCCPLVFSGVQSGWADGVQCSAVVVFSRVPAPCPPLSWRPGSVPVPTFSTVVLGCERCPVLVVSGCVFWWHLGSAWHSGCLGGVGGVEVLR